MSEEEDMEPEGAHTTEEKFQIFLNTSFLRIVKSAHHFSHHISYFLHGDFTHLYATQCTAIH